MPVFNDPALLNKELKRIFGHDKFYTAEQEEATKAVLKGDKDVYINLQPGGGKSLCFQLPTILKPFTVTVIFVPTNVLAKDHVDFLKRCRIKAEYSHPAMPKDRRKALFDNVDTDEIKFQFIYASLDRTTSNLVKELIIKLNNANAMAYIVFDEAHCISRLSHDYMPAYRDVAKLMRTVCPNIPKIALTGTATAEVRRDIIDQLSMKRPLKFVTPSYHPTVYHDVHFMDMIPQPVVHLRKFIEETIGSLDERHSKDREKCGIIFCRTKQATQTVVKKLGDINIPVATYHGALPRRERISIHERWTAGEIPVIAATRQFGIGLHRRGVNFVVHWSMPMSFQQLFQEAGRVNGAERTAYCRVYFSCEEETNIMTHIKSTLKKSRNYFNAAARQLRFFQEVIDYCLQTKCRHITHSAYFGQTVKECRVNCDACRNKITQRKSLKEFLKYRTLIKDTMVESLALKRQKLNLTAAEKTVPLGCAKDAEETTDSSRPSSALREQSYRRLLAELRFNYLNMRVNVAHNLKQKDVCEAARQLEYSLYIGTNQCKKYYHDIHQTILIIRKCTQSNITCGYLKLYETQPLKNPEHHRSTHKPQDDVEFIVLDDDEPTKDPAGEVAKSKRRRVDKNTTTAATSSIPKDAIPAIDFVDLVSDSK